ncbi:MAG: DUF1731 domain-containing protein [Phycisphaerales bacterium]|nr:DUF1731 domain-containing protein [Phycisphaerales bacterium]
MQGQTVPTQRIVVAGGSGFLGAALARQLAQRGDEVVVLSRGGWASAPKGVRVVLWDGRTIGAWAKAVDGCDVIVNLCGRSVDCVKTAAHCAEIMSSRVDSTRVLGEAVAAATKRPRVWVQMSTAHIYGDPARGVVCDESTPLGPEHELAPKVGRAWEAAFDAVCPPGVRRVVLRTGFVLGRGEGALKRLETLCQWGLGGRVGRGEQGMSWLHIEDMTRIMVRAIDDESMRGVYVAAATGPVSNREFMRELRRVAGGLGGLGVGPPTFEWMVRVGAPLVLRTDPELAIFGRYCVPRRLMREGYVFAFSELPGALRDLYRGERV